jgi:predicted DCC family thiol-disulfide oxidoreductase YuxK
MRPKLIVWYNTKCPVCNGGIKWQDSRLVRAARAGAIEFRDISMPGTTAKAIGEVVVSNAFLMPAKKDQAPPDLRYFKQSQK